VNISLIFTFYWYFRLIICVVAVYFKASESTSIQCNYNTRDWHVVKNSYHCSIDNDPGITTRESAQITSVSDNHKSAKTNADVDAFHVDSKTFYYFPRGLETFFKNILVIDISTSKMKEIHQEDLKPFNKLIQIFLYKNEIEVLEEGLFDFNPDLEFIDFNRNKMVHIEPNIFDHLSKLTYLYFGNNNCIDKHAENSRSETKNVIQALKSQCKNSEFSSLKGKLDNLVKDSDTLNSEMFRKNLLKFESILLSSKFSTFRPLSSKLKALVSSRIEYIILTKTSNLETKLGNISDVMTEAITTLNDLKLSEGSIGEFKDEIRGSVDEFETTLSDFKTGLSGIAGSVNQVCTKASLREVKDVQRNIVDSVGEIHTNLFKHEIEFWNYQSYFNTSIDMLQNSMNQGLSDLNISISTLDTKITILKSAKDQPNNSHDDIKRSIEDIDSTLSDLKLSQNELKTSINTIKSSQNKMKVLLDDLKIQKDRSPKDRFKSFSDKIEKQRTTIEGQFTDLKANIEKELTNMHQKITVTIDEKIEGIEKRLMKKFEEVLKEQLGKFIKQ